MAMLQAFDDDRPSPLVVALGAAALVMLIAGLVLVVQRRGESEGPTIAVTPGRIVFASDQGEDLDIWTVNSDGSGRTRLTDSRSSDQYPSWSPDGSKIAFSSDRDGILDVPEIYVMNADGTNQTRLTDNRSEDEFPKWSPDGGRIVFASARDGNFEIYVMNADGKNQVRLTNEPTTDLSPSFSPDGSKILFPFLPRALNGFVDFMNQYGPMILFGLIIISFVTNLPIFGVLLTPVRPILAAFGLPPISL